MARLSEIARKGAHVERDFSFRRGVYCVERVWSRSGEMVSPKRDVLVMCGDLFVFLAQARWEWGLGERMARLGERISPKRDGVFWLLS